MAFNPNSYEHVYGFDLFDTVHNFFPEVMYDDSLFVDELQNWLRFRMSSLFPAVYSRQQNLYRIYRSIPIRAEFNNWRVGNLTNDVFHVPSQSNPVLFPRELRSRTMREPPLRNRTIHIHGQSISPEPRIQRFNRTIRTSPESIMVSILAANIVPEHENGSNSPRIWDRFADDVEVVPSSEQITHASDIKEHSSIPREVVCAVCQDHESQLEEENWRVLHCSHSFHKSCIDSWLNHNVHCPVCRKDIREFSQ
jgi:hypothetical protein